MLGGIVSRRRMVFLCGLVISVATGCDSNDKPSPSTKPTNTDNGAPSETEGPDVEKPDAPGNPPEPPVEVETDAGCGPGVEVINLNTDGTRTERGVTYSGDLAPGSGAFTSQCDGKGNEVIFSYETDRQGDFTVDSFGASLDTVISVRKDCVDPGTELACNDDAEPGRNLQSLVDLPNAALPGDTFYVIVDAYGETDSGPFTLNVSVREIVEMGGACDPAGALSRCAVGARCDAGACVGGAAPVLDGAHLYSMDSGAVRLLAQGSDADADAQMLLVTLFDDSGAALDLGGGQTTAEIDISVQVYGQQAFRAYLDLDPRQLPSFTTAEVALRDATQLDSDPARVATAPFPEVSAGEACDPDQIANGCAVGSFCAADSALCVASEPPVLTSASARLLDGGLVRLSLSGTDVDADAQGAELTFLDAEDADLPLDQQLDPVGTDLPVYFAWPVVGATEFDTVVSVSFRNLFGEIAIPEGTAAVRVELVDRGGNQSNSLVAELVNFSLKAEGADCDLRGILDGCTGDAVCYGSEPVCTPRDAAVAEACGSATVPLVSNEVVTVDSRSFSSVFSGSCGGGGSEKLFSLSIDAPSAVTITTDLPGTLIGTDTVLYVRDSCEAADSVSEAACNDDVPSADYTSRNFSSTVELELQPGTYIVFADSYSAGGQFDLLAVVTPL